MSKGVLRFQNCCSRELEKRPTATDALKEILQMKESQFYDLFLMEPIDDPNSTKPKLPFGSIDDSDLNLIATFKPQIISEFNNKAYPGTETILHVRHFKTNQSKGRSKSRG
ncbi:unnamed protein product, partial [Mesorhabditis belari]|uniref:Uncharacterized protein n=1 Tax=Mesorhabditis belari TaxID=2138241 RepID=A0AAF3FE07_9BILA